ncbi:hypothetical protein [Pararhodonellum marinum]|uniref:hypothetical protein n=1 Tax=Pararhodonellum marinum TaxID=2755358 RepID=UPI001E2BE52C|nr:hypothetical protein [Pararhodonellum marinum]
MAKIDQVESKEVVKKLRDSGRVTIKEGHGKVITLLAASVWNPNNDQAEGIFLLFDLFQIRTLAEPFSEVSLDIVEFATKPTIYHSPVNRIWTQGPIQDGMLRFALIRQPFWKKLLFNFGQPLIVQYEEDKIADFETQEYFPLLSAGTKEMILSPEGDVKILKA